MGHSSYSTSGNRKVFIVLMLLVSCEPTHKRVAHEAIQLGRDTILPITGAVLPLSVGPALISPCTRPGAQGVTGFYRPTPDAIAELERRMPNALSNVRAQNRGSPPFGNYYRQYVGIVRSQGEAAIYVNAFPREDLLNMNDLLRRVPKTSQSESDTATWRQEPVAPCDGGGSFWSVEYHPHTRTFRDFQLSRGVGGKGSVPFHLRIP